MEINREFKEIEEIVIKVEPPDPDSDSDCEITITENELVRYILFMYSM